MCNLHNISRGVLLVEALLLVFPTFWGLFICIDGIHNLNFDANNYTPIANFVFFLITLLALISGWRILFWIFFEGIIHHKEISRGWLIFAGIGAATSLLSLVVFQLIKLNGDFSMIDIFYMGNLFVPTYFHLIFEIQRQKRFVRLSKPSSIES